jgi:hypothetical protein
VFGKELKQRDKLRLAKESLFWVPRTRATCCSLPLSCLMGSAVWGSVSSHVRIVSFRTGPMGICAAGPGQQRTRSVLIPSALHAIFSMSRVLVKYHDGFDRGVIDVMGVRHIAW